MAVQKGVSTFSGKDDTGAALAKKKSKKEILKEAGLTPAQAYIESLRLKEESEKKRNIPKSQELEVIEIPADLVDKDPRASRDRVRAFIDEKIKEGIYFSSFYPKSMEILVRKK